MKKLLTLALTMGLLVGLAACKEVEGGFNTSKNITVYTRDTASGTREAFMKGIEFSAAAKNDNLLVNGFVIADNAGIISALGNDDYGIGYISLSTLDETVKGLKFHGVIPSEANVLNDTYGLKRPFNYVLRASYDNDTQKEISDAFIAFMETVEGRAVIIDKGGITLASEDIKSWDDIKDNYGICQIDNSSVTIKFGGSNSVSKIVKALSAAFAPKCGNFIPEHNHTGSSNGFKRTQGSEQNGPNAIHIGFASRPFKGTEQGADGTQGQLAWDAVVVVVSTNNTLENITAEQLKKIYEGTSTKWEDVITE